MKYGLHLGYFFAMKHSHSWRSVSAMRIHNIPFFYTRVFSSLGKMTEIIERFAVCSSLQTEKPTTIGNLFRSASKKVSTESKMSQRNMRRDVDILRREAQNLLLSWRFMQLYVLLVNSFCQRIVSCREVWKSLVETDFCLNSKTELLCSPYRSNLRSMKKASAYT